MSSFAVAFLPFLCSSFAISIAPLWWPIIICANFLSKSLPLAALRFFMSLPDIIPDMPEPSLEPGP